jgi:hypothetical protein
MAARKDRGRPPTGRREPEASPRDPLGHFFAATAGRPRRVLAELAVAAALLILCLINFRDIAGNGLVNDDFVWLHDARHLMTPGNLLSHRVFGFFRPLVNLSFWAQEQLLPGRIPLYNLSNLLLHWLNTVLVFQLVARLIPHRSFALAVAVLFAIADDHLGAVLWISARTTLLASVFLLAALLVLVRPTRRPRLALAAGVVLYCLALAAKETAAVGALLVLLIYLLSRRHTEGPLASLRTVIAIGATTALYLVLRKALMGGFVLPTWGPGLHALRNLAAGALNQLYPQALFHSLYPPAVAMPRFSSPLLPELLALPALALLLWLAVRLHRGETMLLGIGWMLITLIPESFFRYRFQHFESIQQTRYYYLSTIGAALAYVTLLAALWGSRLPRGRLLAVAVFLLSCLTCLRYNAQVREKWTATGERYRPYIASVMQAPLKHPGLSTIAVEIADMPFPFLKAAVNYDMPSLRLQEVTGGREAAAAWRPCIYVWYSKSAGKVTVHYEALQ